MIWLRIARPGGPGSNRARRTSDGVGRTGLAPSRKATRQSIFPNHAALSACFSAGRVAGRVDSASLQAVGMLNTTIEMLTALGRTLDVIDDRAAFEEKKRRQALALAQDQHLFARAIDVLHAADKYDYSYLWSWMGVPIIQLPADIITTQEVIWATRPDVIVETGVARGGSVLFMASMLELTGKGKVIGVDIDLRSHNRDSIEHHPMAKRVILVEGPSTEPATLAKVRAEIPTGAAVMVVLDSDHSRDHVVAELRSYGPLVTQGCYLVVADTILGHLDSHQTPRNRSKVWFRGNEPLSALEAYLKETDRFEIDPVVNGKLILSSSPGGYLRCRTEA
jgi:cephalosporin hydroxylase